MKAMFAAIGVLLLAGCGEAAPDATAPEPRRTPTAASPTPEPIASAPAAVPDLSNPDCLSYGVWASSLTSDGPDYPLPRFDPTVERRCVSVFRDNRQDLITILEAGLTPARSSRPLVFGQVPDMGGLSPDDDQSPGSTVLITATTALGGQANADALLQNRWTRPSIGEGYPNGLLATWRGVSIEGGLDRAELQAAISSLDGRWAPVPAKATGNDRLDGMNVAARWDLLPDGRTFLAEIGAPDLGTVRDKPLSPNYVHLEKKGRDVIAFVYHWRSDFFSCYRGQVEAGGRLVQAQFVDAQPDPGVIRDVKGLGSLWPDHLVNRPMRPASPRVRREQAEAPWNVPICRDYFAGKQDPAPVAY